MFNFKKISRNSASKNKTAQLLFKNQPFAYHEAYKALRTNLKFLSFGGELKKLVITSAIPYEGKSTFAINLAKTLADSGLKVIVVDADLRNPSIHRYLRIRQSNLPGLSSLLTGEETIDKAIGHLKEFNIDVIMSGQRPPNPAELLGNPKMASILEYLETKYDYVICDTPPVSFVTDAAELSQHCDGVIMVVGQGLATQDQVLAAKSNLDKVKANIIGAVLNNYDASLNHKAVSSDYGYYYGNNEN